MAQTKEERSKAAKKAAATRKKNAANDDAPARKRQTRNEPVASKAKTDKVEDLAAKHAEAREEAAEEQRKAVEEFNDSEGEHKPRIRADKALRPRIPDPPSLPAGAGHGARSEFEKDS